MLPGHVKFIVYLYVWGKDVLVNYVLTIINRTYSPHHVYCVFICYSDASLELELDDSNFKEHAYRSTSDLATWSTDPVSYRPTPAIMCLSLNNATTTHYKHFVHLTPAVHLACLNRWLQLTSNGGFEHRNKKLLINSAAL